MEGVMFAVGLSLVACFGWGIADFIGGFKSRQLSVISVLILSNIFAVSTLIILVLAKGVLVRISTDLMWPVLGGVMGLVAMLLLYKALSTGKMSVVAPISASGVILPVFWGLLSGEVPGDVQMIGAVCAVAGSILVGMVASESDKKSGQKSGVGLAILAAIAIGFYFIVMDKSSQVDPGWAALILRLTYAVLLMPVFFIKKPDLTVKRIHIPALICMGSFDALAGYAFVLATSVGLLSIVAVIGSLYPVVTIVLSVVFLKEKPTVVQLAGIILAISGICLISVQ